jgi:hypothetical protein
MLEFFIADEGAKRRTLFVRAQQDEIHDVCLRAFVKLGQYRLDEVVSLFAG